MSLYEQSGKNDSEKFVKGIRDSFNFDITESPYWPERSFHIHTQHPLELTDVLQGHDIPQTGPHGPHCSIFSYSKRNKYNRNKNKINLDENNIDIDGNDNHNSNMNRDNSNNKIESRIPYCERWEDMVEDVSRLFEWSVANRLNKVEWLLLGMFLNYLKSYCS